jgi:2-polyprenyl-3-methyl-5-hydroxy-6-metoxy-1,4-benzoquinol methylase
MKSELAKGATMVHDPSLRLTDEKYWSDSYGQVAFHDQRDHSVAHFLQQYLADGHGKTSLEAGSFPGAFIPTIARKGYLVHGVDFNKGNATDLPKWLKSLGLSVGEFWIADFFDFIRDDAKRFDLVCSFGLIEHFENFDEVIKAHGALVKPGGQLVLTTPNFRGWMQYLPHRLFDNDNLKKHYLPSMNPSKWKKLLEDNGFEVVYAGYFGGYAFWSDRRADEGAFNKMMFKLTSRGISQFNKLFRKLGLQSQSFSAFCGLVARKK